MPEAAPDVQNSSLTTRSVLLQALPAIVRLADNRCLAAAAEGGSGSDDRSHTAAPECGCCTAHLHDVARPLDYQREVFVAIVIDGIPLGGLAARIGANRNTVCTVMFDARRKILASLVANGLMDDPRPALSHRRPAAHDGKAPVTEPLAWRRFLLTDPADVGCGEAMVLLHVYVELVAAAGPAEAGRRRPGVAAHLRACGPCDEDFEGLLAAVETSSHWVSPR